MSATDRYAEWDAAYVLGSLSGAERREFEAHLEECPTCRRAVAELAGMPGLLAQVPAHEAFAFEAADDEVLRAEPPASLMPDLPVGRGGERRSGWRVPAAAAAAALVIGGVGGYTLSAATGGEERPPVAVSSSGTTRLAFSPVVPSAMTAVVDLTSAGGGTRVQVECQYARTGPSPSSRPKGGKDYETAWAWADYSVWVVDRQGRAVEGVTWTARPDKVMRPAAVSALAPDQIASVEIRLAETGQTVMRAANS